MDVEVDCEKVDVVVLISIDGTELLIEYTFIQRSGRSQNNLKRGNIVWLYVSIHAYHQLRLALLLSLNPKCLYVLVYSYEQYVSYAPLYIQLLTQLL